MEKAVLDTFTGYSAGTLTSRLVRPRPSITTDPGLLRFYKGEARLLPFLPEDSGFTIGEELSADRLVALRKLLAADSWAQLLIYFPPEVVKQIWIRAPAPLKNQVCTIF
jgi:hypothetical protein